MITSGGTTTLGLYDNASEISKKADIEYVDDEVNVVLQELNTHIDDSTNPHQVTKDQVGLGNVDNTTDLDKPVSNPTQDAIISAVATKAETVYVDNALSNLSTAANKFYPTLAEANADIANIAVNQPVTVGEVANGGLWYKATAGATSLTKSPYDPKAQAVSEANSYTDNKAQDVTQNTSNNYIAKYFADEPDLLLVITDANGNLTWVQIDKETGLPTPQTAAIIREINKLSIVDGEIKSSSGEKIAIALRDENNNLTALTVREEDGMFLDDVIENIKQRLNIVAETPDDFRAYDTTPNINLLKSVSAGVIRHLNSENLPSTPYDFVDSLGQGARIYLPSNYNDGTPIPLVMVFDGVGGSGGSEPPTVRSQFTSVLLANGVAICKSQAHGNSYGNPACMQSYLEVFQKACEIAPIGAVILVGNSMGGIAAQNALLTNTIPNVSGLYLTDPTYDLRQRYDNGRKPEITSAYGIAADGSDYTEKTAGYDPALRHWSHYRSTPIFIRASSGDTSVVLALHGQKLKTYLAQHNDVTLVDTGTAGHNTSDRFNGEELLSFIKKCTKLV